MSKRKSKSCQGSSGGVLADLVRGMISDFEQIGIGDEDRSISGADAVQLLNIYLPHLRRAVDGPRSAQEWHG